MQKQDFVELFEIMAGLPVTIRLLDPPLHEFLPHGDAEIAELAQALSMDAVELLRARLNQLKEHNPMLGHRGCRLGITYPEIYEMQARAIFEAAVAVSKSTGAAVIPEIMIPLVATKAEFDILKTRLSTGWPKEVQASRGLLDFLPGRHDDRAAAGCAHGGRYRRRPPSSSPSAPTISRRRPSA